MTNWKDPLVAAKTGQAFVNMIHAFLGLIIWEICTTCGFELDVLRGRRPYRWTIWIYVGCRVSALVTFMILAIETDASGLTRCTAWDLVAYTLTYMTMGFASLLMLLRITAIWNWNTFVVSVSFLAWLASIGLNICVVRSRYVPLTGACTPVDSSEATPCIIGAVASDLFLLLVMLAGILRHGTRESLAVLGIRGLWSILWHQGLMWLGLAVVSEVPALILIKLNLNVVAVVTLSIGSTRMYRMLAEYHSTPGRLPFHMSTAPSDVVNVLQTKRMHRNDSTLAKSVPMVYENAMSTYEWPR
ncbi:hypothetical protein FA95DRAFT_1557795 [Auriscalpium vulgare]|uniref:Uncharacterized protein n=1 Tax=Auriscalpium vulgare TaxID=40419 RepID=A0ACB8RXS9_9AGAM|nr:hypothetical protein FA95DRAFT_1557795 [Auriscalpium vulgare]